MNPVNNLDLNDLASERAEAYENAKKLLRQYGGKVAEDVRGMFIIMVEQLVFARVLEDRLLTVIANADGGHSPLINARIVELAGELSAQLIGESDRGGAPRCPVCLGGGVALVPGPGPRPLCPKCHGTGMRR